MENNTKIKQLILESRNIVAEIGDEGGKFFFTIPVFAWALFDDDSIEPRFIDDSYMPNYQPYGIETIRNISKKDVDIIKYNWVK